MAPPDAVRFTVPWQRHAPEGPVPLTDDIPAWDYLASLPLAAVVEVNSDAVREACHLGAGSELRLIVTAASSTTKMRGPVAVLPVMAGPMAVDVRLTGHELGGRLSLETLLVVAAVDRTDALSPRAAGSIVWRHRRTSWLEGESARFPTEVADLGSAPFFTPRALWYVEIEADDLDSAALGGVRLVLNEAHPAVERVLAGDASAEATATLSMLRWDVARQLVFAALDNDELIERGGEFEDETLGAMLAGVLSTHWPGESPRSLRQLRHTEPGRFERELQDRVGLLGD
jgi:hypothetical protein